MRKTLVVFTMICSLFLALAIYLGISYLHFKSGTISADNLPTELLCEGDLIFRQGKSMESYAVYLVDPAKRFSHAGIILFQEEIPYVVHVVPGGQDPRGDAVRLETARSFLSGDKASSFAIYRPQVNESDRHTVAVAALSYYRSGFLFDHDYDLGTEEKLYCTELIYKAFRDASVMLDDIHLTTVDLGVVRKKILLPGNLIQNSSFQMIFQQ